MPSPFTPRTEDRIAFALFAMILALTVLFVQPAGAAIIEHGGRHIAVDALLPVSAPTVHVAYSDDPVERWAPLVAEYFDHDDVDLALRIIACESGGQPNAKNRRSTASGLFQHLRGWWAGRWSFDPFDPEQSIEYGAKLFYESGVGNWNASRSCWSRTGGAYSGVQIGETYDIIAGDPSAGVVVNTTPITVP